MAFIEQWSNPVLEPILEALVYQLDAQVAYSLYSASTDLSAQLLGVGQGYMGPSTHTVLRGWEGGPPADINSPGSGCGGLLGNRK